MTTNYPTNLPAIPEDRWGFEQLPGGPEWVVMVRITADSVEEAECRALAVMDYDFEDDLSGATATSSTILDISGKYVVLIQLVGD